MTTPLLTGQSITAGTATGTRSSEAFPSPFLDMASLAMPTNIHEALRWSEFIVSSMGPYREALSRVISYFITDIEVSSPPGRPRIGREEKQKYEDFLNDTLGIKTVLATVGLDYMVSGNSFTSLIVPFRRYLSCPGTKDGKPCGLEMPLRKVYHSKDFAFSWNGYEFHAKCPSCGYQGKWRHIDRRSGERGAIRVMRWSPHEMEILYDQATGDRAYIWQIPDDYRNLIRRGQNLYHIERASWEVVQAIKNNQALLFDDEVIYHMREEPMAGVKHHGWGMSRVITNFRQAWYYAVLHRMNEAIALDYVIPFRVITPMPRPSTGGETTDPVLSINLNSFTARVQRMIADRRRDPAQWNVLPFPVDYKALGGDATQLAPKDLLEMALAVLLNSIGVPRELFEGNLSMQAAPSALRLFEAHWSHLVHNLNRFLQKLVDKISQIMSWEPVVVRLQRVRHADDLNLQMSKLQLMMGGQISQTTGLAAMNLNFEEEVRRIVEEQREKAEAQQEEQEEMESASAMGAMQMPINASSFMQAQQDPAAAGGAPPSGAPPGQTQAGPSTPQGPMGAPSGPYGGVTNMMSQISTMPSDSLDAATAKATALCDQLMGLPASQMESYLINLKRTDPTLHALVKSLIEDKRNALEREGRAQLEQQLYNKQGSAYKRPLRSIML